MNDQAEERRAEIVIIRRRPADDATAGKGGAWKIAYADFVTAMMAFFLVMWLINASNEATRAQVASYFNPIKLTDSSTGKRGLNNPKEGPKKKESKTGEAAMENKDDEQTAQEEKLLADPQKALDHIIKSASPKSALHIAEVRVEGGSSGSSIDGQVAPGVGDPFDPKSWEAVEQQPVPQEAPSHASSDGEPRVAKEANPVVEDDGSKMEGKVFPDEAVRKEAPVERYNSKKEEPTGKKPPAVLDEKGDAETAVPDTPDLSRAEILAAGARKIEGEILARIGKLPSELSASLNVSVVETGVLISLTDKHLFGMFRNGSAEPELQLIELVEAIAHVLQTHPGGVVVRGHTDSKPFRNRKYDNWQLSTARAHMAQYMLVRGGLEETRIHRVEGLADREPRVPGNPDADENRRIDILLETAQ